MTDMALDPWSVFDEELDAWHAAGRCAGFWWRDDDAVAPGPLLDRLFNVCSATGLLLAVVPSPMKPSLAKAVADAPHVRVAQHGFAHINHAPRGQGLGAWELGLHRDEAVVLAELDQGRERLAQTFGDTFLPVLVPPWNHVAPELYPALVAHGYSGLSLFGARTGPTLQPGLLNVNVHCDPLRWKTGPKFAGELKKLTQMAEHLRQRRLGEVDADEPTGFVTHHIDLDEESWGFSEKLAARISEHPGARWVAPSEVYPSGV